MRTTGRGSSSSPETEHRRSGSISSLLANMALDWLKKLSNHSTSGKLISKGLLIPIDKSFQSYYETRKTSANMRLLEYSRILSPISGK
jgi:hypothetical protein